MSNENYDDGGFIDEKEANNLNNELDAKKNNTSPIITSSNKEESKKNEEDKPNLSRSKKSENNKSKSDLNKSKSDLNKSKSQNKSQKQSLNKSINNQSQSKLVRKEQKQEEEQKKEEPCSKCKGDKKNFDFNCNHKICINCLISYFISSNLSGLSLEEITFKCPICQNGIFTTTVDAWSEMLDENQSKKDERNRTMKIIQQVPKKKCFNHKDQDVTDYCLNCKLWLCEECKKLFHNQYYSEHQLSNNEALNIFCESHPKEVGDYFCLTCDKFICGVCILPNGEHEKHRYITQELYKTQINPENGEKQLTYENYDEFKERLESYKKEFFQKLSEEYNIKIRYIDEAIKVLNNLKTEYECENENFKIKMNKIFNIIKQAFFNYFSSTKEEKQEIKFQSSLYAVSLISKKKVDVEAINIQLKSELFKFENENQSEQDIKTLNFELIWNNNKVDQDSKVIIHQEGVTRIVKLIGEENSYATASLDGKIIIWQEGKAKQLGAAQIKARENYQKYVEEELRRKNKNPAPFGRDYEKEDYISQKVNKTLEGHKSSIWSLIQGNNKNLYSGSSDKTIIMWNVQNAIAIETFKGHKGTVYSLALTKDEDRLLSGSDDKTIIIWKLPCSADYAASNSKSSSKIISRIRIGATITSLSVLVDKKILCSADDNELKLINLEEQKVCGTFKGHGCTVWCVAVFDDAIRCASGSSDNSIKIWNINTQKVLFSLEGHQNTISALKFLKNSMLASSSWDATIKIWNISTRSCIFTITGHEGIVYDFVESDDEEIISCSEDKSIRIWRK